MKRPLTLDGLPRSQRAGFYLLEMALLLLLGGAATVYCHGRYHPVFAGNPLYALPFWQRVVLMTALFSTLDGVWVLAPRRWEYPLPFGITLLFMLADAVSEQITAIRRRSMGR